MRRPCAPASSSRPRRQRREDCVDQGMRTGTHSHAVPVVSGAHGESTLRFRCDLKDPAAVPLLHSWEHTIGSGHATLALRADWQRQLTRCRRELGFRHVRFHGLLSDDVGTLVRESDELVYSFFNADQICDFLLSIDMRPFCELSFMPTALASGGDTVFHYRANVTPPKDYDAWATLIRKLAHHWVDRYGLAEVSRWFFEVWNEPNLKAFWTGSQADYFQLYARAARAIKDVHGSLQVGGPATADNQWIPELVSFCESKGVPLDFVSTHHYPTDAFGKPGDDTVSQLAQSKRSVLREEAAKALEQASGKPLYYTEWSTSSNPFDDLHDQPYAAAFIAKTVMEVRGLVHAYSYWTFSDIFEENYFTSKPFHGGFGLLTIHGVPKPAYRAYEILHRLGDEILPVAGHHPTVDVWVTRNPGSVQVLLTNGALPEHPIRTEMVRLTLSGVKTIRTAYVERIDDDHANARRAWMEMGQPDTLLPRQVAALETASALIKAPIAFKASGDVASLEVAMPAQGTALVTLELA
jgi:xylan 1,4-beta-xylosidase